MRLVVLVPTIALLDQWAVALEIDGGLDHGSIGTYSGESRAGEPRQANVIVLNTARTIVDTFRDGRPTMLVVDECHRAGSPENARALAIPSESSLGLSATPVREFDDGFQRYVEPALGGVIFEYDYATARRDGVISPFTLHNFRFDLSPHEAAEYDRLTRKIAIRMRATDGEADLAGNVDSALASAATVLAHTYTFAQNDTVPLGPMCSVAEVTPNGAVIYSSSAHSYQMREWVKNVLDVVLGSKTLPLNRIRVFRYESASEYGGRFTTFDVTESAAIMSAVVGKPVRVQLMRWDQHGWNNGWVAHMFDVRGGMDRSGNLVAIEHADWLTPTSREMAAEQQITGKTTISGRGYSPGTISSGLQYGIPNRRAIRKDLPLLNYYFPHHVSRSPYRVQAGFAVEQLFDELAHAAKMDPYEFRLQNVATTATDPQQRWRHVLTSVAKLANWQPRPAASGYRVPTWSPVAASPSASTTARRAPPSPRSR